MRKINKCTGNYQCYHFLFFNENKSEWDKKNIRLFFDMVYKKQTWAEVKENSKDDFTFLLRRTLLYIWLSHFAQPLSVLFILLVSFHFSLLSLTAYSIYSIVSFLGLFCHFRIALSCIGEKCEVFVREISRWLFYRLSAIAWINDRIYYLG